MQSLTQTAVGGGQTRSETGTQHDARSILARLDRLERESPTLEPPAPQAMGRLVLETTLGVEARAASYSSSVSSCLTAPAVFLHSSGGE